MKKVLSVLVLVFLLIPAWVLGADCETITVADTAIGFTTATYQPPSGYKEVEAYCCNETAQIRVWYDDDTVPTAAVGFVVNPGDCFSVNNSYDIKYVKAIRTGASSGSLTCCYSFPKG